MSDEPGENPPPQPPPAGPPPEQQQPPSYPPQYPQGPPPPGAPQYPGYPQYPGWTAGQPTPQPGWYPQAPARPNHPQAGLALGLGIGGLVGALMCVGLPLLISPFAWAIGHRVRREIRESNGTLDGDSMAQTGMVLGIIGTALLVVGIIALAVLAVALLVDAGTTTGTST